MLTKLPPPEKIYEAYSALADERVAMEEDKAYVESSDRAKKYTVAWEENAYTSNDNATYWAGYPGYPVLAVLMKQGLLDYDEETAALFAGIDWKQLNTEYKRNYAKAAAFIFESRSIDEASVRRNAEQVMEQLRGLDITVSRGKLRPPKTK